jgi:hypothetical protein
MPDDSLRASHADRDRVVEVLREAAGDGRLTSDELDERLERALTARTYGELATLTADLPATTPAAVPAPKPKDVLRIERYGANERRDGDWVVPGRIVLVATAGNVTLDFTAAVITLPSLEINAMVNGGNLTFITRPGIVVDTDEVAVIGGRVIVRQAPGHAAPALLRVTVGGRIIGGNIRVRPPKPPRRTLRQRFRQERS